MFDSLVAAAVTPSDTDHRLPRIAQPLAPGRLGVARVVFLRAPSIRNCSRTVGAGADGKLGHTRRRGDPAAPASPMAVANGEHRSRIAPPRIVAAKGFVNVLLRQIEPPLLDLNRSVGQLRPSPKQTSKIGAPDPNSAAASETLMA